MASGTSPDFDSIKLVNNFGVDYWSARALMPLLGYGKSWQNFEHAIEKAKISCEESGQRVENHFNASIKMVSVGSGAQREIKDYNLTRLACYLIAMNGNTRKKEIAEAQLYFAVSTRSNEMHQVRAQQEQRLLLRQKIIEGNKSMFEAASLVGVDSPHFGIFEDAGILGQYTLTTAGLEEKRDIAPGELFNTMPPHEQAGSLLRITQTDYNLRSGTIQGEDAAIAEHYNNGRMVREAMIRMSGGQKPEDISPAPSIRKMVEEAHRKSKRVTKKRSEKRDSGQDTLF